MRFSFISFMRLKRCKAPSAKLTPNRYPPVGPVCAWVHNSPHGESRMPMPLLEGTRGALGGEAEVHFENVIAEHLVVTQPLVSAVTRADQGLLRGVDAPLQLGLQPIGRRNGDAGPAFQGLVGQEGDGLGR